MIFIVCSACTSLKHGTQIEPSPEIPESYNHVSEEGEISENFSTILGNDELDRLIQLACKQNINLKTMKARIAQADARFKKERASLFPDLNLSLGGKKNEMRSQKTRDSSANYISSHSWDSSLSSNYTLDVFGKNKADRMVAEAGLQAAQADLEATLNKLKSQIAGTWIEIIGVRNQKKLLRPEVLLLLM